MPLINISIIWLCSLLAYELLLKKETFHRANRLYLLLTFMAGIVLPLLPWGYTIMISQVSSTAIQTMPTVAQPATGITQPGAIPTTATAPVNWWRIIYLAGASASLIYLLYDSFRLVLLYRKAVTEQSGKWIIAQTGQAHTPFSFLNIIFVGSREQYTAQQWQMVLQHEQQHCIQKHILDLVLLQLGAIVFWFHPLVYVYRHKLRLLHEYEADQEQEQDIQIYGHFLIEQAVLRSAPAIAHSFNYSPIKNRIHMITKSKSKRSTQLRLILLLPMMAGFIYCCASNKSGIEVTINDNHVAKKDINLVYTSPLPKVDSVYIENPLTGERIKTRVESIPRPDSLNNQKIIKPSELLVRPQSLQQDNIFDIKYIIKKAGIEPILAQLPDGQYAFSVYNLLIDQSGHIVYFSVYMPHFYRNKDIWAPQRRVALLSPEKEQKINEYIAPVLINEELAFTIEKDEAGKAIPYLFPYEELQIYITVKDQQLTYNSVKPQ